MPRRIPLAQLFRQLTRGRARPLNGAAPPWFEPGEIAEVSEEVYFHFLEILPPRWMNGSCFVFAEGPGPFRLFWRRRHQYFGRQLTKAQARRFCERAGVSLHL